MSITASRFGSSPLMLDWSGLQAFNLPQDQAARAPYQEKWDQTLTKLRSRVSGFYDAAITAELNQLEASLKEAQKFRATLDNGNTMTDCIFIGIGGSSLGPMCLLDSLKHRATPTANQTKLKFHFFENPDPIDWQYRIAELNPRQTMICVVTKSGTTYETLAIFMLAYDWLKKGAGPQNAQKQTVGITDPMVGELREFCLKENISLLTVDPCIGGRYSIFTPVGLFAGALAGLDMTAFLQGAKKIRDYCEKATLEKNLFITWGSALQSLAIKHPTHVMMPYATPLKLVANWWVQLWAESLGKDGKGFTAVPALGAIDQHSMLQLLRDGPNDKIIWFMNIQDFKTPLIVPSLNFKVKTFDLLEGQELSALLTTEFRAIQKVMINQKRPSLQIQLDELNEEAMGSLFFTLCVLTSFMGELLDVNPFDQPGVEEGKVYIRERLIELKAQAKIDLDQDDGPHRLRLNRD